MDTLVHYREAVLYISEANVLPVYRLVHHKVCRGGLYSESPIYLSHSI